VIFVAVECRGQARGAALSCKSRRAAENCNVRGVFGLRLDRFISQSAGLSRSQARVLIRRGHVRVAGQLIRDAGYALACDQAVELEGRAVDLPRSLYLMMHKPAGLLSATRDRQQATVLSLLPPPMAARVHLVGRLDKDTSGLLLLTDDGAWSHRISSPRYHCAKTYLAELAEPLAPDAEESLARGVMLRGEKSPTLPAAVQRLGRTRVRVRITEGRYHQVRRMFAAVGNRVTHLHREAVGGLYLDAALAPGQWRALSEEEIRAVIGD
jgi:16S rRNA pseudouridine516 synthase